MSSSAAEAAVPREPRKRWWRGWLDAFKAYIRKHELRPDVYYRAYPQATVQQVKSALQLRAAMNGLLAALNE